MVNQRIRAHRAVARDHCALASARSRRLRISKSSQAMCSAWSRARTANCG